MAAIAADDDSEHPLNAIRRVNPLALEEARVADRDASEASRPLHGMPIVLKDNIDIAGMPTTSGCVALAGALPWRDAGVVRRLKEGGAIFLAKTNLSEFSFEIRSRSSLGGDVLNPFDRDVTAGGSSGGSAAAVAAGFAVAALGTDTGGSVRTPAAFNGLVGLRPTQGLIDRAGVAPLAPTTDTVGILSRSVFDAKCLLAVLTDHPGHAAWDAPAPHALRGARIGVLRQAFGADPLIVEAMEHGLALLAGAGATIIDPVELTTQALDFSGDHIVDWEFCPAFDAYLKTNFRGGAPESIAAIIASGDFLTEYAPTLNKRAALGDAEADAHRAILASHGRLRRALSELFDLHALGVLVYPTSAVVPISLDNPKGGWAPELAARSGRPAVTLPVAQAQNGVPIGFEMLGRPLQEWDLLNCASILERMIGKRWRPPAPVALG